MRKQIPPEPIIARLQERIELDRILQSNSSELLAVYGRRRVGKTFLIRQHYRDCLRFEASGLNRSPLRQQLESFGASLGVWFPGSKRGIPSTWIEAFEWLQAELARLPNTKSKKVIFFDEFPWFDTPRSGFLPAFEWFWNTFATRRTDWIVVICGSAAAWMIRKVIQSKGGLHNRVTRRMRLLPFSIGQTKEYLEHRSILLDNFQVAQLYMGIGGIPHYLNLVAPGLSAAQVLQDTCLRQTAPLRDEYQHLYSALFDNHQLHEKIIAALAKRQSGLQRDALLEQAKITSGGGASTALDELIAAGFIVCMPTWGIRKKECNYYLTDEFSHFYWTWMTKSGQGTNWSEITHSRRWRSWCGYAFESLCLKHIETIKRALGIAGVETKVSSWRYHPKDSTEQGAQIDLIIDRADRCMHLCEMKFSENPFAVDKQTAMELGIKQKVFQLREKTNKTLFTTLITANGLKPTAYEQQIPCKLTLDDLMHSS